jgi:lambda family phage portal protein
MKLVDQVLAKVAPARALRRARERAVAGILRGYDGAKLAKRGDAWLPATTSANAEIGPAAARLRARVRDLVRNNPYAARARDVLVGNLVGTGITPQSRTGDDALDARVEGVWREAADALDADLQLDAYGLQALAAGAMIESGEVFARRRPRQAEDGLPVPMQVQLLEADHLDATRQLGRDGNDLVDGIELDLVGRRAAYWMWRRHPGEAATVSRIQLESVRVPASEIAHLYRKQRPGQLRGAPWFAPSMIAMRDLDEFFEAGLVKKKIEACFAGFVVHADQDEPAPLGPTKRDDEGARVETLEPGLLQYLRPGEDVKFAQPTSVGGDEWFVIHTLMRIAVGVGVTYHQMTGDLRQANYSSLRAGQSEFRRIVEQLQHQCLIPMHCTPVWRWVMDAAVLAGRLPRRGYPVEWTPPKFDPVDPLKDVTAEIMAIRAGLQTLHHGIQRQGYDPRELLRQIASINAEIDELGLTLTTDPRKVTDTGVAQAAPAATPEE